MDNGLHFSGTNTQQRIVKLCAMTSFLLRTAKLLAKRMHHFCSPTNENNSFLLSSSSKFGTITKFHVSHFGSWVLLFHYGSLVPDDVQCWLCAYLNLHTLSHEAMSFVNFLVGLFKGVCALCAHVWAHMCLQRVEEDFCHVLLCLLGSLCEPGTWVTVFLCHFT